MVEMSRRSPARSWVGGSYHATLTVVALLLAGCGGDSSDPCKTALTATFETVPNGLLPSAPLGGIDITSSGSVMVLRDGATTPPTPAVLIGNGGKVVLRARCDARSVELAFDDSDAPLTIDLYAGDDGGALGGDGGSSQPALRLDAAALVTTPDTATGYRRATVAFPNGGQIRRIELSSTGGPPTQGALIRLITFTP